MKNRLIFIPAAALLFILFMVGTFLDLQISQSIVNLNATFLKKAAGLSLFPLSLIIAFVGGSFIRLLTLKRYKPIYQNILIGLYGVVCIGFSTFLFGKEVCSVLAFNLSNKWIPLIGIIASIPGGLGGYFLFKYVDCKGYIKKIMYISIVIFVSFGIIFVIKRLAPRIRYVTLVEEIKSLNFYRPWYQPDLTQNMIDALREGSMIGKESIQSFPSGHSSSAMLLMILISSLPLFIDKLKDKQIILFYIGFAWYLLIGFIRFYVGAHYVSDITFAGLVALGVYFIGNEIYLRKIVGE